MTEVVPQETPVINVVLDLILGKYGRVPGDLDRLAAHVGLGFDGVPVLLAGLKGDLLRGAFWEAARGGDVDCEGAVVLHESRNFAGKGRWCDSRGAVSRREDCRECGGG